MPDSWSAILTQLARTFRKFVFFPMYSYPSHCIPSIGEALSEIQSVPDTAEQRELDACAISFVWDPYMELSMLIDPETESFYLDQHARVLLCLRVLFQQFGALTSNRVRVARIIWTGIVLDKWFINEKLELCLLVPSFINNWRVWDKLLDWIEHIRTCVFWPYLGSSLLTPAAESELDALVSSWLA